MQAQRPHVVAARILRRNRVWRDRVGASRERRYAVVDSLVRFSAANRRGVAITVESRLVKSLKD